MKKALLYISLIGLFAYQVGKPCCEDVLNHKLKSSQKSVIEDRKNKISFKTNEGINHE